MTLKEKKQEAISQIADLIKATQEHLAEMYGAETQEEICFRIRIAAAKANRFAGAMKNIRNAKLTED